MATTQDANTTPSTDSRAGNDHIAAESVPRSIDNDSTTEEPSYPKGVKLVLIFLSLCLATLLCALDATIIATAIPTITSDFNSLNDYSWYNAAYLLTTCAFQLPYGRAYSILSTKWTFVSAIAMFEVGSAVAGPAVNSLMLIIGRAIQGIGSAGIFGGAFIIISETTPLEKRSIFTGFLGATFAIASVVGPLLGGALSDHASWRFCFYINLPLGAITLVVVILCLPPLGKKESLKGLTWQKIVARFDPVGSFIIIPSIICLLLALQWGGVTYQWSDPTIIGLLVCFAVTFLAWAGLQVWMGDNATVSVNVIKRRTVLCANLYMLLGAGAFTIVVFYLPIWFQAIKGGSAFQSGIDTLPLILSLVIASIAAGGGVMLIGYTVPFLLLGTVFVSVGAGSLMTLQPSSGIGKWLGYQILFGIGVGVSLEQTNIAIQTVLPKELTASGISLTVFTRSLAGSIAVAVAQNTFEQSLRSRLNSILPDLDSDLVSGAGATDLIGSVREASGRSEKVVQEVLKGYNAAVTKTFLVVLVLGCLTLVPALGVEWKSVKKDKKNKVKAAKDEESSVEKEKRGSEGQDSV
ncbi:hypothetical protein LTR37_006794 [Vermiconidia calcicola]|uniref:Uncharacterized protein n=1 Tax=Vermiconidia calcicola TaxID=1690605 RepID=A0ACC3NFK1_9PEZI|nr:hypothetical protein LTR37_006794 [Vermiconidia calcicola]